MNRLLKSLLQTGLYLLQQPDRGVEPVRDPIVETAYQVARRLKGEDHTLRYILTFAVGVGVGLGVGILTAPPSGEERHSASAGKVRRASDRATPSISLEGNIAAAG
jgi:hypothetical protein